MIYAENDVTSITVGQATDFDFRTVDQANGDMAGEIIVLGDCGDITSVGGDIGGLIMIGGQETGGGTSTS